jgi:glycosyltransferase involved in cell wall biosynthesis
MKIALISHRLPPSGSGQALVIYRMLQWLSPESYCLISSERYDREQAGDNYSRKLPGRYYHLPPPFRINRGHRFGLYRLREGVNIPLAINQHARRITAIVRREKCGAIVACTGDVTHMPAAYMASRRVGVAFYAYIFDHYSYREWQDPAAAFWARRFEPRLMKSAAAVIAPNETLRDDLRERYGVEAAVIHNSFDISPYEVNEEQPSSARDGEIKIVYTGDIYEAHYDAFRNLVAAIESLGQPEVKLHLYTDRPEKDLDALGIRGPVVRHPHHAMWEMPGIQMEADLLFLPLAFDSPYPELVRTSATTKLGEYLAARRPVLVHAPPDSFVSWYFRRHNCGMVVDRSDPLRLAEGIRRVLGDAELRGLLSANAWERAHADFDIERSRAAFAQLIGLNGAQRR